MLANSVFAFLHFFAAFGLVAALVFQWMTFSRTPTLAEARRIQVSDRWYGMLAGVILVVGFLRVFYFEKGSEFYFASPFFRVKLLLFLAAGLLSIYPTVRYIRWGKQTAQGLAPVISETEYRRIALILKLELGLLAGVMLAASLMARGF